MILRAGGAVRRGPAIEAADLAVDAPTVRRAIGDGGGDGVTVACPPRAPIHEHVGVIEEGMALDLRAALACAARSQGAETPADERIADLRERSAAGAIPEVDLADPRRRVASASGEEAALRERVAALRGRVTARRELGEDPEAAAERLRAATARLAEAETERVAAEQALAAARRASRENRDERERRLRLADRLANAEREARRTLVDGVAEEFAESVGAVPGGPSSRAGGSRPEEFEGDQVTAALAVVRLAAVESPVVLDCRRFESAAAARACLDAPVLRL